jgi:hypothetical protein
MSIKPGSLRCRLLRLLRRIGAAALSSRRGRRNAWLRQLAAGEHTQN